MTNIISEIRQLNWKINSDEIIRLIKPCIQLISEKCSTLSQTQSKLGGKPLSNQNESWPIINGKPLVFLGQINFNDLAEFDFVPLNFKEKIISFFISNNSQDYRHSNYQIHFTTTNETRNKSLKVMDFPEELDSTFHFEEKQLSFKQILSIPSYQHWSIEALNLTNEDEEIYTDELAEIFNEHYKLNYQPGNKIFGYSDAIQGDTNYSWAKRHDESNELIEDQLKSIEKKFKMLIQFDFSLDFKQLGDGCAYFGYLKNESSEEFIIQCELQNT